MPLSNSAKVSFKGLSKDPALASFTPAFKYLWRVHLQSCARRGLVSGINPEQFSLLIASNCHYCGTPPTNVTKIRGPSQVRYNGIDRIDNSKPYSIENLAPRCKLCNSMKSRLSLNEFILHVRKIAKFYV